MMTVDPHALADFLARNARDLAGIVRYSRGQWSADDIQGEAYVAAALLAERRGRPLDLADSEDADRLLRRLRSLARQAGGVLRSATRPDQAVADEAGGPRSWEHIGVSSHHPGTWLADGDATPDPDPAVFDPYHSEVAAWNWLVWKFDRRMVDVAAYLFISVSWCHRCRYRARNRIDRQWPLPHALKVDRDDGSIRPWRHFKLPSRQRDAPAQLPLDYWCRPMQPASGQLWLL